MDHKVGFCAVSFSHDNSYIRWPILGSWREAGERLLFTISGAVASNVPIGVSLAHVAHEAITDELCRRVVDAVDRMDPQTLASHSYALMAHLGRPCFVIDADTLTASPIETQSWMEADQEIDRRDQENNNLIGRLQREGNQIRVTWPIESPTPCSPSHQLPDDNSYTNDDLGQFAALSDRERDTILAALRVYQYYLDHEIDDDPEFDLMVGMIAREHSPAMSADEIDDLCERINH
jgi:hypothetical protein